jgi:uncharacterized membrane protein
MDATTADRPEASNQSAEGNATGDREQRTACWIAAAFVFYGLVATALFAINTPPFQVADEPLHFMRAAQIAEGDFVGTRFTRTLPNGKTELTGGGAIDPAIVAAATPFSAIQFHPEVRAKRADWAPNIHWSSQRALVSFPTANYPPIFYLPSSAGILLGREFNLTVVQTLYLSRLLTGMAAVALGALAIAIAGGAAPWLFTILTLPMSLSLMASTSQDALLIACGALAGALLVRGIRQPAAADGKLLAGLAVALALVAMARPPFGALALLPLGLPRTRLWRRIAACLAVVICTLSWARIAAVTTMSNFGAIVGADPAAQIQLIRHQPFVLLKATVAAVAMSKTYLVEFIGALGWMDTSMPIYYYKAATAMLVVAAIAAILGTNGKRMTAGNYLPIAAGLACAVLGVFLVQYVAWTPPGRPIVEGIEGRYFLAPALAGAALLPALGRIRAPRLQSALLALILVFPAISLAVAMRAIVLRYYLG